MVAVVGVAGVLGSAGCFGPIGGPTAGSGSADAFKDRLGGTKPSGEPGRTDDGRSQLTLAQVDAWTNAFADRWASYIQDATTRIVEGPSTPEQRRAALAMKSASISSVYDIAVRTEPLTQLLDMVVLASLEHRVWVSEGLAQKVFGDRAHILTDALTALYTDITVTSINAMNGEQYDLLTETIDDWRRQNPDIRAVEFVRLSEFAKARASDLRQQIQTSGLFAPINEATRAADELKVLGQRGMWVGIRAPQLLSWQAEGLVDQVLARPEISEALAGNDSLVRSADRLSRTAADLPALIQREREAIFKGIDEREAKLGTTIGELKATVEESRKLLADTEPVLRNVDGVVKSTDQVVKSAQELTKALTETVNAAGQVVEKISKPSGAPSGAGATSGGAPVSGADGKPFEITEYTKAAEQLTTAVKELNVLVASATALTTSPAWKARLDEVDALGKKQLVEAEHRAVKVTDAVFWRALILIGAFFVGLTAWTVVKKRF